MKGTDISSLQQQYTEMIRDGEYENYVSDYFSQSQNPVMFSSMDLNSPLWREVPFAGSLIVMIPPIQDDYLFEKYFQLPSRKIPELIDFVKSQNKIFFMLSEFPVEYKNCDILKPIIQELNPPTFYVEIKNYDYDLAWHDMNQSFDFRFYPENQDYRTDLAKLIKRDFLKCYSYAKWLGLDEIADSIMLKMYDNPIEAVQIMSTIYNLIIEPTIAPIKGNPIESWENISMFKKLYGNSSNNLFPYEIGSFICDQLILCPKDLQSCKQVMKIYDDNDLLLVSRALNNAIQNNRRDSLESSKEQLDDVMKNIWDESKKIADRANSLELGTKISILGIGSQIPGLTGFLASIGLEILDHKIRLIEKISHSMARKTVSPSLCTIYDFQQKYRFPH